MNGVTHLGLATSLTSAPRLLTKHGDVAKVIVGVDVRNDFNV